MLTSLTIRDIVLIDSLEMRLARGLGVLTGETGAGKSILLDALGLATGVRSERGLVSHVAAQGVVTAEFELESGHPALSLLAEHGLVADGGDGPLILRRVITEDGRSRAFVNDQAVSIGFLKDLGGLLVEVHGQHDDRGLLNPSGHRALLDAFVGGAGDFAALREAWETHRAAARALHEEQERYQAARADEDYLRHSLSELRRLNPAPGEEAELAGQRMLMIQGEKVAVDVAELLASLSAEGGVDATLRSALRRAGRMAEKLADEADRAVSALGRAAAEASEAIAALEDLARRLEHDPKRLEATEERLFALRALARKHQVPVDELPALKVSFEDKLDAIDRGEETLGRLRAAEVAHRTAFETCVDAVSAQRCKAAARLDRLVNGELASLKLEKAKFRTRLDRLETTQWGAEGGDRVEFEVSTNPGAPFGPLTRIASGGELSRFILALKVVVLASQTSAATLIFDEVDRGVGGAVAEAVGERLARLAEAAQVLAVTHSPQVAALGEHHWKVVKVTVKESSTMPERVVTRVVPLNPAARREEIARMLAGAKVTDEARAAAGKLIERQPL